MEDFPHIMHILQKLTALRKKTTRTKAIEYDVAWEHIPILSYINGSPLCTQQEVAAKFLLTPAAITLSTQKLEKAGLILKKTDNTNLRVKRLVVTDAGHELVVKSIGIFDEVDNIMRRDISDTELHTFKTVLEKMYKNLLCNSEGDEPVLDPWD